MLTQKDLQDVLIYGQTILECRSSDELRNVALDQLLRIFNCQAGQFYLTRAIDGDLDLDNNLNRGISADKMFEYTEYYYQFDPMLAHFPPSGPILTMEWTMAPRIFLGGEYYNDFLKSLDLRYELSIHARPGKRALGVIAIERSIRKRNFSREELTKAKMISTYLTGALERVVYSNYNLRLERLIQATSAQLPFEGIMAVDESLTPIYRDAGAERILARLAAEEKDEGTGGGVALRPLSIVKACRELLEEKGIVKKPCRTLQLRPTDTPSQDVLSVEIRLITHLSESPLILIGFSTSGATADGAHRLKKKGVSKRELEVIYQVLQGRTNSEIAQTLFISEYTVQNHLQSIYRKLGINNRTSLISELMVLPLPVEPEGRE